MDLSCKSQREKDSAVTLFKPKPRPAWSILWYRSIWPKFIPTPSQTNSTPSSSLFPTNSSSSLQEPRTSLHEESRHGQGNQFQSDICSDLQQRNYLESHDVGVDLTLSSGRKDEERAEALVKLKTSPLHTVTDVATCDGPVQFQRISNPNFALTVEHHGESGLVDGPPPLPATTSKTHLCIYCNQSFKSLFCYQKHKKRHLNPVSVDITSSATIELSHAMAENTLRTADLNVQFFPCKKCGSKFPSYYFVHKHKRVCERDEEEIGGHGDIIQ